MALIIRILVTSLFVGNHAATFLPIEIAERMKNSDAAIFGELNGKSFKKLPSGDIVTEYSFKVEKFSGLKPNDIVSKNNYKVIVPGGVWNNEVHKISGTPKFTTGEKVVLMVKKGAYGYILPDLAMSKFKVEYKNNRATLYSDIFPETYNVGKINLNEFNELAESIYGKKLTEYNSDKFIYKKNAVPVNEKNNGRYIASASEKEAEENEGKSFSFLWLILGFSILGFVAKFVSKGNED